MVDFRYANSYDVKDLQEILAILRSPEGCPWDKAQTHTSIRRNMLEEAYEAVEAIDENNPVHLQEELGDVLLQVIFHARLAEEAGHFTMDDVVTGLCKKLLFRHPHVFGDVDVENAESALSTWETQKREEKGQKTVTDTLNSVARSLPSLVRAEKIQKKAKKVGFDWNNVDGALDKVTEELGELREAITDNTNIEEELGDLLFATVNVSRFVHLDAEETLQKASEKFIRRFGRVEELAGDTPMETMQLDELDALWNMAKQQES